MTDQLKISNDLKIDILKNLIEPSYLKDINEMIHGKRCWRITGQVFETASKVLVALGSILSFSSGYFNNPALGFIAGSVSTVSLAMLQFSSFSYRENKKRTSELNLILQKLGLDTIPQMDIQSDNNPTGISEYNKSISNINLDQHNKSRVVLEMNKISNDLSSDDELNIKKS